MTSSIASREPRPDPVHPLASLLLVLCLLLAALPAFATGPTLNHPASNGTEYVSLPYFDWEDFVVTPYTGSYEIQIDDTSGFTSPVATATIPALISFFSPHDELTPGTYYWRVRHLPATGTPSDWSSQWQFTRSAVSSANVFEIAENPTWPDVKDKLQAALDYLSEHPTEFVELRFPEGEDDIVLTQPACPTTTTLSNCPTSEDPSPRCLEDEVNDYVFRLEAVDNIIVNGRNRKIVVHAQRPTAGIYFAKGANHLQLKDLTIDYAPDSLSQFGGEIIAIDGPTRGFTVEVTPGIYGNSAEFEPVQCGLFVNAEHRQRVGSEVRYMMNQTWQGARVGTSNLYNFNESSQDDWDVYADELAVGDYFVSTARGGDVIWLNNNVTDFVANNLTVHGSRGRYFIVRHENSAFNRSIGNHFLRTQGRILGSPSGGVNNKGYMSWFEDTTVEWTRDDAFHTSAGSQVVLLDSKITGAYRNSAWIQSDRSWVEGNLIRYAGTDGIALGGAASEGDPEPDTQVQVGLIKSNTVLLPRQRGIVSRHPGAGASDPYNRSITLAGNTVRDHQSDEAVLLDYLMESVVTGTKVESTGVSPVWRIYSNPNLQMGIHVAANSELVSGTGNKVTDPRIECAKRLVPEPGASNITVSLTGPATGLHESWNCATVSAFTAPGTLTGDHTWTINANNFKVEVLDNTLLGSRAFGRIVNDVLPLKDATALDTHTTVLPQTLSPGTKAIRLQARFVFNALTTSGRAEARLGVEDATTGQLYGIGLSTSTAAKPVTFYGVNVNNTVEVGTVGDQSTSGVWQVDATFRRVSSTSTTVTYTVTRPNGAPYSGTATFPTAVGTTATFDRGFIAFKQRGQVVFDWIQATAID